MGGDRLDAGKHAGHEAKSEEVSVNWSSVDVTAGAGGRRRSSASKASEQAESDPKSNLLASIALPPSEAPPPPKPPQAAEHLATPEQKTAQDTKPKAPYSLTKDLEQSYVAKLGLLTTPAGASGLTEAYMMKAMRKTNPGFLKSAFSHPIDFLKKENNLQTAKEYAPAAAAIGMYSLMRDGYGLFHPDHYTAKGQIANIKAVIGDGITLAGAAAAYYPKTRFLSMPVEAFGLSYRAAQLAPEKVNRHPPEQPKPPVG